MKISLIGNCQIKSLTWYIQQLDPSFDTKYIYIDIGTWQHHKENYCHGRLTPTIADCNQAQNRLAESDYIIYQPIRPSRLKYFNYEDIQKYRNNAKLISISCFYYQKPDKKIMIEKKEYEEITGLLGMKERAEKFNLDIQAHKIIEECGVDAIATDHAYHPKALYFLELVKRICEKTGWDYYNAEQHAKYLKEGFPFG